MGNATVLAHGDYRWHYQVRNENVQLSTLWKVEEESYTWNVTRQPNLNAMLFPGTSQIDPALDNDALAVKFNGAFVYGASVDGTVKWQADSERFGKQTSASLSCALGPSSIQETLEIR